MESLEAKQTKLGLNESFYSLNRVANMRARQNLAGENIDENIALRFPEPPLAVPPLFNMQQNCEQCISDSSTCCARQKQRVAYEAPQALFCHMHLPQYISSTRLTI